MLRSHHEWSESRYHRDQDSAVFMIRILLESLWWRECLFSQDDCHIEIVMILCLIESSDLFLYIVSFIASIQLSFFTLLIPNIERLNDRMLSLSISYTDDDKISDEKERKDDIEIIIFMWWLLKTVILEDSSFSSDQLCNNSNSFFDLADTI